MKYTVLRDTREQQGWSFVRSAYCEATVDATLPTGDYSLLGYEQCLTIERKGSTAEFAKNVVENRFERELQRMDAYAYPFMVLEFTMDDIINFPRNSGIPTYLWPKIKTSSYFLLKRLMEFHFQHKTKIILAGTHGREIASSIFKRTVEHHAKQQQEQEKPRKRTRTPSKVI